MADIDFAGLAARLLGDSRGLLESWFPEGKWRGKEYVVGNIRGDPGDSLSINANTGTWADFADRSVSGGDLISLYAAIHGLNQAEAARQLDSSIPAQDKKGNGAAKPAQPPLVIVPTTTPPASLVHPTHGAPTASWPYLNAAGEMTALVARYDPPNSRKQYCPWSPTATGWVMKMPTDPRPLFGLDLLAVHPDKPVMIVEGEKCAMAARAFAGHIYVVITWMGGAGAWRKTDWSLIYGRKCLLWPDPDEAGAAMRDLAKMLSEHCPEVKVIDVAGVPAGFDAATSGFETFAEFVAWAKPRISVIQAPAPQPLDEPAPAEPDPAAGAGQEPPPIDHPPTEIYEGTVPVVMAWKSSLVTNKEGVPLMTLDNVVRMIENDPELEGRIWYDEFLDSIMTSWSGPERRWCDVDDVLLQLYAQRFCGLIRIGLNTCHDAAYVAGRRHVRNECRDWMNSLVWDQTQRLDYLLSEAFGSAQNSYTSAVGRCWLISMVARVMRPGCKVDTVPVLEGGQGIGKSTALSILGGKWFIECHESVLTKDFYGVLDGHMLVEISEMHSFTRTEVERVKGIISCQVDRYRRAYGRNTEDHPRQSVLTCTTNRDDWQRDDTGARRFWPVLCSEINLDYLRNNRDQLFAEAVALFKIGATWWKVPPEMQQDEVEKRREVDSWESIISSWLIGQTDVSTSAILTNALDIEKGKHSIVDQKRVGRVMRILGYVSKPVRFGTTLHRMWVKVETKP